MIEGYCVKCKAKRSIADAVEEQMKNGRKAVKGKCPTCGAVMFKILGGKSAGPCQPATSGVQTATTSSAPAAPASPPSEPGAAPGQI